MLVGDLGLDLAFVEVVAGGRINGSTKISTRLNLNALDLEMQLLQDLAQNSLLWGNRW